YAEFVKAVKIDSLDWESIINVGVVEYRRKNYAESAEWEHRALQINPKDFGVMSNLADALRKTGKYDSAISTYTTIIANRQMLPPTWINFGDTYIAKGD